MNILLSADCFYPVQMNGPSNTIYWQAKALQQAGHRVRIVATAQNVPPTTPRNQWMSLAYGEVIYTQNPHFYFPVNHIWYGWQAIRKADIIHVNSFFYPASLVWVLMCRLVNKPVVWSPHGELSPEALRFRPLVKRVMLKIVKWLRPSVLFHAASSLEAEQIRQHFGADAAIGEIRSRMELPDVIEPTSVKRPYLLFIGRWHPIKAIDRLLEALGQSRVFRESAYQLIIVGPEADRAYTRALTTLVGTLSLSTKVVFLDAVDGEQKQHLYANAYVTILPSHSENFGNVVIESLAQGTPVIASKNTPWQLLDKERAGSWVANDPHTLRQAIDSYLIMPPDDYRGYRERAIKLVHRHFSITESVGEWEHLYEQQLFIA